LIWIDGLLVYSKSFEEHLQNLGKVFQRLRKFNIKLKSKKSELFPLHIIWCGKKICKDGVSLDPAYLKALSELPRPETAKQLQRLLSTLNWIRSTIPDYARKVAPLQEPLKYCQGQSQFSKSLEALKDLFSTWKSPGWPTMTLLSAASRTVPSR